MGETVVKDLDALAKFAVQFVASQQSGVVGLSGGLGAGKTTFVRACIAAIAKANGLASPRVTSPSYTLHQIYDALKVEHFDLYRLEDIDLEALMNLGYPESVERTRARKGFLFVEWPEKARDVRLLELDVRLTFEVTGEQRTVVGFPT